MTPDALRLDQALGKSGPLGVLRARLQASQSRFDAILPLLPDGLAAHVKPGPLDDAGWSLLAANSAVAAKLRQSLPWLEQRLVDLGFPTVPLRIKTAGMR